MSEEKPLMEQREHRIESLELAQIELYHVSLMKEMEFNSQETYLIQSILILAKKISKVNRMRDYKKREKLNADC